MAAPEYVPVKPMDDVRTYESPPRRPDSWVARRPGDLKGESPRGARFGNPGPDQGFALVLARRLVDRLQLDADEKVDDAVSGCLGVGLKRASLLGRAPVIHDMTAAFTLWGFLDTKPNADLVALRKRVFEEVALSAHYAERQLIVAAVRDDLLRAMHTAIADWYAADWRSMLDLDVLARTTHD